MTPEFILWGVVGYITLIIVQTARPSRNRSGWDFVALVALCALVNFSIASFILGVLRLGSPHSATALANARAAFLPRPGSGLLAVGLLLAPFTGWALARRVPWILDGLKRLAGRDDDLRFADVFFKTGNKLLGKPVVVSLTSGKVYVGLLIEASGDPNESERSIVIQPIMSGFRDDHQNVTFNVDYLLEGTEDDLANVQILLPMKQVQSLSSFEKRLHEASIKLGFTKVEPTQPDKPGIQDGNLPEDP